ncbi:hypothetical protein MRX96_011237 [Rhipicephalus microplus]
MIRAQLWCCVILLYGVVSACPWTWADASAPMTMYFYDKFARTCKPFAYGGVGGNLNRFYSFGDCMQKCHA